MRLSDSLKNHVEIPAEYDRNINQFQLDSRAVQANDVFVAVKGRTQDGRIFIQDALQKGCSAVLTHADSHDQSFSQINQIPLIPIVDLEQKIAGIAARFYHYPARHLHVMGVTGTNGKTSCAHYMAQLLESFDIRCGIIGTLGYGFGEALKASSLTTPNAIHLQAILKEMHDQGAKAVAMEVSSHSIDQGRVNDMPFQAGMFTNLSQDHLDYHKTMEQYAAVKYHFLKNFSLKHLIVNSDDAYAFKWLPHLANCKPVYAYSIKRQNIPFKNISLIYAKELCCDLNGMRAEVVTPWGEGMLETSLIGSFNMSNLLSVVTALLLYGKPLKTILEHCRALKPIPGRMQKLGKAHQPLVIVDYSHTPDSLDNALKMLRSKLKGRLICVFGCGGDRDQSKRPIMAKVAEECADYIIVTNDNPRFEDPIQIAKQITSGFSSLNRVLIELDRSKAIENSIQCAKAGDCILIAGKGAEQYQQIGHDHLPFDDMSYAKEYLDYYFP